LESGAARRPKDDAATARSNASASRSETVIVSGRRLQSLALVGGGNHARVDGFVSLGVLASPAVASIGLKTADPIIGLLITLVIVSITSESWRTIRSTDPARCSNEHAHQSNRRGRSSPL
jgi:Co/Zn/Cd efflux system component